MEEDEHKQYVVIKIRKPAHFERFIWILVVVLLLTFLLYKPVSNFLSIGNGDSLVVDNVEETSVDEETMEEIVEEEEIIEEESTEDDEILEDDIENDSSDLSGKVIVKLSDADSKLMGDGDWGKIDTVNVKIENGLDTSFTPLLILEVYQKGEDVIRVKEYPFDIEIKPGGSYDNAMALTGAGSVRPMGDWIIKATVKNEDGKIVATSTLSLKENDFI